MHIHSEGLPHAQRSPPGIQQPVKTRRAVSTNTAWTVKDLGPQNINYRHPFLSQHKCSGCVGLSETSLQLVSTAAVFPFAPRLLEHLKAHMRLPSHFC